METREEGDYSCSKSSIKYAKIKNKGGRNVLTSAIIVTAMILIILSKDKEIKCLKNQNSKLYAELKNVIEERNDILKM